MVPDLTPDQIVEGMLDEAMTLFNMMFQMQRGRAPTADEVALKRVQVRDNIKRFGGLG